MQNTRRITQAVFLLIFFWLFLQTESKGADELGYPVKIFLDLDPLIFISNLLSSHSVQSAFFYSLIVVVLTILLGRVFCGWVCPLGTLNNVVGFFKKGKDKVHISLQRVKYYILIFLLLSSLFTMQLAGIMDPISLLIRSLAVSIYPIFNLAFRAFFDAMYALDAGSLTDASEAVYSVMKDSVLSFRQPFFYQGIFIGAIFLTILGLNFVERRFWCRNLCPLGALLGLLSRYSLLKRTVSEGCNECGSCDTVCQTGAGPHLKEEWNASECIYCWNCDDICPQNAVSFGFSTKKTPAGIDLGRRRVVMSAVSGAVAVPLLRATPLAGSTYLTPRLIRPPGALEESEFLKRCVKCGECMKVCITNGLQPTFLEAGLEGIWSPMLVPQIGYCEFRCTLCGQVCPTGAIEELPLEKKKKVKLGLAMIDMSRCLPHAHATPCIVCEEVCPTPKKAIWFEQGAVRNRKGEVVIVQAPRVDLDLCIGCGICEAKCPVRSKPAIYVTNADESRSESNRLLL